MQDSQSKEQQNLEYSSCCLCGENRFDYVLISKGVSSSNHQPLDGKGNSIREKFNLVRCRNCGLQQVSPRPTKQHIGYYYAEDYYAHTSLKVKKPKEKSPKASKYARDELHLDVKTGDLLHCEYKDSSFDAVTMWHSLEHLYDPLYTLKEIGRILNNNGLLVSCSAKYR
jgi:SAM-dependent methyltransferase